MQCRRGLERTGQNLYPNNSVSKVAGRQSYWFFIHYLSGRQSTEISVPDNLEEETTADLPSKLRHVEAALFLSRERISSRKLAKLAGLADATEARTLIRQLNQAYDEQGRSFKIEEIAGGYALLTRSQFAPWLRKLKHVPGEKRLSQSTLETLSVVAYRQPVLRADIEAIRGVGCSETLKQLMELDLIRISGRSEDLGRPYLYGTTRRFLQMFGLRSADRLPRRAWVNETSMTLTSPETVGTDSGAKEPSVTDSFAATALLEEEIATEDQLEGQSPTVVSVDDDDEHYDDFDDVEDDDYDDEEDGEDDEWDDDEDEDDEEDDLEGDDLEDDNEWKEVDDDDSGWEDDDDEDEDDDDWGDDDEEEDWD